MPKGEAPGLQLDAEIRREIDKCMRCGFCMSVCPVYATEKREAAVARGKIGIAEALVTGALSLDDPEVVDILDDCLVCKSCMQSCPSGVQYDRIILGLREAIVEQQGLPWTDALAFTALKHPALMNAGMKAVSVLSPFSILNNSRLLPMPTRNPLRERVPSLIPGTSSAKRAAFFTGCVFNYFYPETGIDIIDVLKANGVEVAIPQDQQCCGTPALVHGDTATARTLARKNIDAMERTGAEYIVTGCGSCGGSWQHEFTHTLAGDSVYAEKAAYWSARTYDISMFLTDVIHYRLPQGRVDAIATYHDSCHLKKSMKVAPEPREILRNIPGVSFKEMSKPDACCGGGGSYMMTHEATSGDIGSRKAADAAATGANVLTTGCPACMMQLRDVTHRAANTQTVSHYISLLAESYRRERQTDDHTI